MKQRCNLWLADWRDSAGRRHRKGFASKREATTHQTKMQHQGQAEKKAQRPARSGHWLRPGQKAKAPKRGTRKR